VVVVKLATIQFFMHNRGVGGLCELEKRIPLRRTFFGIPGNVDEGVCGGIQYFVNRLRQDVGQLGKHFLGNTLGDPRNHQAVVQVRHDFILVRPGRTTLLLLLLLLSFLSLPSPFLSFFYYFFFFFFFFPPSLHQLK